MNLQNVDATRCSVYFGSALVSSHPEVSSQTVFLQCHVDDKSIRFLKPFQLHR